MKKVVLAAFIFGCLTLQAGASTTSLWPNRNRMTIAEFIEYLRSYNPFLTWEELHEMAQEYFYTFINTFDAKPGKKDKDKDKNKGNGNNNDGGYTGGEIVGDDDVIPFILY